MYPSNVLQATENLELSYIFSLLRTGVGYSLYAIDPNTEKIVGATVVSDVGKRISDVGFQADQLELDESFHAKLDGVSSHCLSKKTVKIILYGQRPPLIFYKSIAASEILLLAGLLLISMILVWAVTGTMNPAVIGQIKKINGNLRAIQHGDIKTKVDVSDSKEFLELSIHINSMVDSLLQSSEKLEMSEKIKSQKEELEQQHEQLEAAVEHAEAANRAKSEFLFNMSHDIRTPMNAILGFTTLALESGGMETQREYLKNIDISSKQLLDIINNILELSRIENHKIMIGEDLVDVRKTCRKLCTIFDSDLKKSTWIVRWTWT